MMHLHLFLFWDFQIVFEATVQISLYLVKSKLAFFFVRNFATFCEGWQKTSHASRPHKIALIKFFVQLLYFDILTRATASDRKHFTLVYGCGVTRELSLCVFMACHWSLVPLWGRKPLLVEVDTKDGILKERDRLTHPYCPLDTLQVHRFIYDDIMLFTWLEYTYSWWYLSLSFSGRVGGDDASVVKLEAACFSRSQFRQQNQRNPHPNPGNTNQSVLPSLIRLQYCCTYPAKLV